MKNRQQIMVKAILTVTGFISSNVFWNSEVPIPPAFDAPEGKPPPDVDALRAASVFPGIIDKINQNRRD